MSASGHRPEPVQHVVQRGPGVVAVEEREPLPVRGGDVRVAIAYGGICGSDLHVIDHPDQYAITPEQLQQEFRVLGHESSGVVVETGHKVSRWSIGDRVALLPRLPCGQCRNCHLGRPQQCLDRRRPCRGSWAQFVTVGGDFLRPVPDDLPLAAAALAEPTACVLRAIDLARIRSGSRALIIGAGPMGLLLVQLALRSGVTDVLVSEPHAVRRQLAEAAGAQTVDPTAVDLHQAVAEHTAGLGADVTFEAAGLTSTVEQSIDLTAVGGTVVIVGVTSPSARATFRPHDVFRKELTITAAWGCETTFQRGLQWLRRVDTGTIITDSYPLAQVSDALSAARNGSSGKVLLRPLGDALD